MRWAVIGIASALLIAGMAVEAHAGNTKRILGVFYAGCEDVRDGFTSGIVESGFEAEVMVRDIGQDKSQLPLIVEEVRAITADLVLTCGTSATLGIIGRVEDLGDPRFLHDIPVVFTVVADPFGSRIAESFERSGRANVTGTFNRVPESVNLEVIRQYDPTFNVLGLLYNSNEQNSVIKMRELETLAPQVGVELVALELDPANDGPPDPGTIALRMAEWHNLGVRWIYMGSSSFLLSNAELYTSAAVANGIAVLTPYEAVVREHQALLSIAARFYDVGRLAAEQALRIVRDGASPGELPIVQATDFAYVVNMDVAKALDLYPPFAFLQVAETVKR